MEVIDYLNEKYEKTGWPFFTVIEIINKFGEDGRSQLNTLLSENKVEKHKGFNHVLVKLRYHEQKKI